jgi:hypothetical protein
MSAEELRRAAALMRERAKGAYWIDFHGKSDWSGDVAALGLDEADAAHVTGMSPAVALAVASLLDAEAATFERDPNWPVDAALAVARVYLGES